MGTYCVAEARMNEKIFFFSSYKFLITSSLSSPFDDDAWRSHSSQSPIISIHKMNGVHRSTYWLKSHAKHNKMLMCSCHKLIIPTSSLSSFFLLLSYWDCSAWHFKFIQPNFHPNVDCVYRSSIRFIVIVESEYIINEYNKRATLTKALTSNASENRTKRDVNLMLSQRSRIGYSNRDCGRTNYIKHMFRKNVSFAYLDEIKVYLISSQVARKSIENTILNFGGKLLDSSSQAINFMRKDREDA